MSATASGVGRRVACCGSSPGRKQPQSVMDATEELRPKTPWGAGSRTLRFARQRQGVDV